LAGVLSENFKNSQRPQISLGRRLQDGFNVHSVAGQLTSSNSVVANGREVPVNLPSTIEEFLVAQGLLPRSVVVELNGEAVAPSEFGGRQLRAGDRLEIVRLWRAAERFTARIGFAMRCKQLVAL